MTDYYLATNKTTVFHYGKLEEGQEITTGQPFLFYYATEQELIDDLTKYGQEYKPFIEPKFI